MRVAIHRRAYFTGHCSHCDLPNTKRAERKRVWMTDSPKGDLVKLLPLTSQGSPHLRHAICKAKYLLVLLFSTKLSRFCCLRESSRFFGRRYPITFLDLVGAIYIRSLDPNLISFYIGEADAGCCVVALFCLFSVSDRQWASSLERFYHQNEGLRASYIPENGVDGITSGVLSPSRRTQPRSESYRKVKGPE
jgi:hypothetical protein